MEIERFYTKDEILERYLNIIYLGAGAYGVDAAAHTYFGRSIDKVTLAQAAMLAGVVGSAVRLLAVFEHGAGPRPPEARSRAHGGERIHLALGGRRCLRRSPGT